MSDWMGIRLRWRMRRLTRGSRGLVLGGVWLRWRTWRRRYELDRQLAAGADPKRSDELSARVGQLGSARTRARLAAALRGAVEVADRLNDPLRARPIRRTEIRANRALLDELARALSSSRPLGVEGLAMVSLLVGDTESPLYDAHARCSVKVSAFEALVALERGHAVGSVTDS